MAQPSASTRQMPRGVVVTVLGALQIPAWGSTFYLLAVLAKPIAADTGWAYDRVMGGLALGLLVAGAVSPRVGRAVARHGGRAVLPCGAVLIAGGLALIGTAQNLAVYFLGWAIAGAGMGAGLYDSVFATLGALYGRSARGAITAVTLLGGFASTVCWPCSAFLVEHFGWRAACLTYAAWHICLALPLYLIVIPSLRRGEAADDAAPTAAAALRPDERFVFVLVATVLTVAAAILSLIGSQLVVLLQGFGVALTHAVALGMIIGPGQVGARLIEMFAGSRYHPIWTMIASAVTVCVGVTLLFAGPAMFALAILLYAGGNGIGSIARGTLPMALFGPARYPVLAGKLALPMLCAMALSPYLGALALELGGVKATLALIAALALINVALVFVLYTLTRGTRADSV
ncbi:MAG TPA: MFS transporter [Xanthobacteraceae bacterium]|nr:MFS transporter [Xanthobacteraceae bacterium]